VATSPAPAPENPNDPNVIKRKLKLRIPVVYLVGIVLWPVVWVLAGYFTLVPADPLLIVPFVLPLGFLVLNLSIARFQPWYPEKHSDELELIEFVERHGYYMIVAVSASIVAVSLLVTASKITVPLPFIDFIVASVVTSVGVVLPLVWIPGSDHEYLTLLRHVKTVPLMYAIGFYIAGFIAVFHVIKG